MSADIVLDLDQHVAGNDGTPDTIAVSSRLDGSDGVDVRVNGQLVLTESASDIATLTINGSSDSDTLIIDAAGGLPGFQINYNAGAGLVDALDMIGLPASASVTYATLPGTADGKSGVNTVTAGGTTLEVHFTGIEPQTFVGAGGILTLDATSTAATSMLTVSDTGVFNDGVNIVTGDGGFEDTTFSGFDALVVRGGGGSETITADNIDAADPDGGGPGAALTSITLDGDNTGSMDTAADTINLRDLPATVSAVLLGGGGSDIINIGTTANSLGSILGSVTVGGEGHDAGNTDLTINGSTNSLASGDILNLTDAGDAGAFTYALDATTLTRSGIGTITYGTIETLNLTTSLGSGGPTTVNVTTTAVGVNTNITTQSNNSQASDINVTTTGADSNVIITTSTANDDVNIANTGGDGPDANFLQGSFTRINTSAGNDIFTQQNAAQNSFIEVNLDTGTDTANVHAAQNAALTDINAGDNTDTLNWGSPSNTLSGYVGILQFDGGNHDAGSSSLTIKGETNTLDSGDIVNLNDQGETAETGYQFQQFGSSILAREGAGGLTYTNTETFNVNTTSGVANFIGFGSAPGININYNSQDANDTFLFFDGEGIGADVNFVINSAGGADDFDIDETGGNGTAGNGSFGAFVQINAGNDNDTFTIDDVAANDRIELNGQAGDDTFNVTPSLGVINVLGGTPAAPSMPGDTLNFTEPGGQTSTLVNQTPDSGTYQTTGGFADVCYDEIESGPPPVPVETEITLVGGTLTVVDVNGGTSDDNLQVFLLGTTYQFTDNNGNIIDASSIPGSTGSGTTSVNVPAAGVTGIDVRTLGGDDSLLWLNVAAVDYSVGGISIDGGTGDDSMTFSASLPVTLNNADVAITSAKEASLSGTGPYNLINGNVTVNANTAGTFPGIGNGASLGATINVTGTGNVTAIGRGGMMGGAGVLFQGRVNMSATGPTAGTVTLDGQAGGGVAGSPGVTMTNPNAFITSVDGDIMITGVGTDGGDDNYGIEIDDIDRIESTGTGADAATITLNGTAGNGAFDNAGLRIFSGDIISAEGDISLTGVGGTSDPTSFASAGVSVLLSTVQVNAGNLTIDGTANGGIAAGVWLFSGEIASIGSGTVDITATANALGPDMKSQNINNVIGGASSSSPFTINADSIEWANLTVQSTGELVIQPRTAGTSIGLGGGTGDLNLDDTELGFLVDGFSSITIGDTAAGTGTVDIDTVTFADPITIAGGTINDAAGPDIAAGTNAVTLKGNVSPGQSPGILTVTGNFAFGTGATYEAEIMGTAPGTQHDQIDVIGTVDINNATLNVDSTGFTAVGNETFVLINNDGADAVTGTFNGRAEGSTLTLGGRTFAISYVGGDGNDVVLTTAPVETEITLVGGTLTVVDVNGGTSDDNLVVFLLGTDYQFTDNNGNIIDSSSIPGSTGSGTNMVTVPAAGVTGIDVRTLGGDDSLLWLNVAAVDYSVGGISIDGGTGDDSMTFSASLPVTLNNADVTITSAKEASLSGAGPYNLINGNVTVNANTAGTFPGIGNGAALGATINVTGTGNVTATGRGGMSGGAGVLFQGRVSMSATGPAAGTVTLDGQAGGGASGSRGVTMTNPNAFITSVNGDITITGVGTDGGDDNYGIEIDDIDRIESTGTGVDAATITLNGTAGNGAFDNAGLRISRGDIISAEGDISLTGVGGTADPTSFASAGVSVLQSTVQVDAGNLTIDGTANGGIAAGVWLFTGEILSIGSGTVDITATANTLGPDMKSQNINNVIGGASSSSPFTINADSIEWANLTVQSTGDLVIQPRTAGTSIGLGGGTGDLNLDDTELGFLVDGFSSITIGDTAAGTGTVDIDTVTFSDPITIAGGTINDAAGNDIAAGSNAVTLQGNVSPGQSPGILTVTGNFAFGTGATYEAEIMGTTPGTQHDQIDVIGTVDINNATLNIDSTGFTPTGAETFVLINNDGADAVIGTFNALAEASIVTVGGIPFVVSYIGGDGNDVVLLPAAVDVDITRADPNPTTATSIDFDVVFSRDVSAVDPADFVVVTTGSAMANTAVTVSDAGDADPKTWVVSATGVTMIGTVGLDFSGVADIQSSGVTAMLNLNLNESYDVVSDRHEMLTMAGRTPGNVTATVAAMDLNLASDPGDNAVVITQNAAGDIVVAGLGGTTVNGMAEFTAFTGTAGVLPDDLRFTGSAGKDYVIMADISITTDAVVNAMGGIDAVAVSNVDAGRDLNLRLNDGGGFIDVDDSSAARHGFFFGGVGDDEIRLTGTSVAQVTNVTAGDGANTIVLTEHSGGSAVQLSTGADADTIYVLQSEIGGGLTATTNAGEDSLLISGTDVAVNVNVNTGTENDFVDVYDTQIGTSAVLTTAGGDDIVRVLHSTVGGVTNIPFASDSNVVDLQDNTFSGQFFSTTTPGTMTARIRRNDFQMAVQLVGGVGANDVLLNGGDNTFSSTMNIARFDDTTNALLPNSFSRVVDVSLGQDVIDDRHGVRSIFGRTPGNVAATFTGPDLLLSVFSGDNTVRVTSNAAGDVIVEGLDGTTVNGIASFTALSGVGGVLPDDLRITGFPGHDLIEVSDITTTNDVNVIAGTGSDGVVISNVMMGRDLRLNSGTGAGAFDVENSAVVRHVQFTGGVDDDRVAVAGTTVIQVTTFTSNAGDNELVLKGTSIGTLQVSSAAGDDEVRLVDTNVSATAFIQPGAGDDHIEFLNVDVGSTLFVDASGGDDVLDADDLHAMGPATLKPGADHDAFRLLNSQFDNNLTIQPPSGNNVVDIQDTVVDGAAAVKTTPGNLALRIRRNTFNNGAAQLIGGTGTNDTLMNDGTNSFAASANIARFEDLTNTLIDEAFEDLLGLAFP